MVSGNVDTPSGAIPEAWKRFMLNVHTSMPGEIVEYDPVTRRAKVQPGIDLRLNDGTTMDRPIIGDVLVIWLTTSSFLQTAELVAGDQVLLLVSERGLEQWKLSHAKSPPGIGLFQMKDAIAIPGLGPMGEHTPPVTIKAGVGTLTMIVKDPADVTDVSAHRTIELGIAGIRITYGDHSSPMFDVTIGSGNAVTINSGRDHIALRPGSIGLSIEAAGALPGMSFSMDQSAGLQIGVDTLPIEIVTSGNVTVNGKSLADADAGTALASGPGSHRHTLTGV